MANLQAKIKSTTEINGLNKKDAVAYSHEITNAYNDLKKNFETKILNMEKILTRELQRTNNRVVTLEREALNHAQYLRRRQIELWNLPDEIYKEDDDKKLKEHCAEILSFTDVEVKPADIDVVHALKKEGRLIMELGRRDLHFKILKARKNLKNKKKELGNKKVPKVSVVESMAYEFRRLDYISRQLVKQKKMDKSFFFNRKLHVEVDGEHKLITHIVDLYQMFTFEVINEIEGKNQWSTVVAGNK